ncbi:CheR family methyltransferase [Burkholderia sp. PAMC 26561]|uniref:CheR family methyltransferase n=1 Tax=Burkholderia sp. PAMC 26561 TaxID=1795043 RepID=UPI00076B4AF2|nr:CheR family methyltransferase [Burkholderia sp. PAMC 26561]AME28201.1 chemotaxis protein [Burkholderia sp. PAMC 26561]
MTETTPSETPASRPIQPLKGSSLDFPVVGIGASAGGIPALLRLFENMPSDTGMAFVIVLHLSPTHESVADQVLQRSTKMRVVQVNAETRIEKNCIYLISPSNNLSMMDGHLGVTHAERPVGRPVAIDLFFRSLAEAHGAQAISVILSGSGSDGAVGIGRIKEFAGITIAQSPEDAEYDDMPRNAIATGMVDIVLPVGDIPQKLIELWNNMRAIELPPSDTEQAALTVDAPDQTVSAEEALHGILATLQTRTGHDFHHYKRATVLRRIERRLQVNALASLPLYRKFLDDHPDETSLLLKDMLIGVTNFFRDRDAFEALEREVVPKIVAKERELDEPVRVWVAGCSTGEEVYSLAILLSERLPEDTASPAIHLFATDIDQHAIEVARRGSYPESILTDVPPTRLDRFFTHARERYVINKSVREKVLFAPHNLLRDPPFSQVDLVSCRNLLIYLDRTVQRQIFQTFHFALKPGGFLFLGSSESAEVADDLFVAVDKKNRIYQAKVLTLRPRASAVPVSRSPVGQLQLSVAARPVVQQPRLATADLHRRAIEHASSPSVIVDRDAEVVHMSGEVGRFFHYMNGEPSHNLLTLIHPDLRLELRTALFGASQKGVDVATRAVRFSRDSTPVYISMLVHPYHDRETGADVLLISFVEFADDAVRAGSATNHDTFAIHDSVTVQLEAELQLAKENLQSSIEQSSVSTEELKASNEELQAIVEELRSASEELETSKEELHSVNEELVTVNAELQAKVEETAKANDDLENLIASTNIATIFVDRAMRIKSFTAPAVGLFNLLKSDKGRPLLDLTHHLHYPELAVDAAAAFGSLKIIEREVETDDGRWFLARLLPYRTADDRIDGAVLTLIDVTSQRQAQSEARKSEGRLTLAALSTDDYGIIVKDMDGVIVSWNKGAEKVFGYKEADAIGKSIEMIFLPEDRAQGIPQAERIQAANTGRAEDERWHLRCDGSQVYCSGVVTLIDTPNFRGYAKIVRDVTDKKGIENKQQSQLTFEREVRLQAEAANRLKDEFFAVLSHELKNPLNLIHVKAELLTRAVEARGIAIVQEAAEAIQRSVIGQAKIIDDLLDLSRVRTGKLALDLGSVNLAMGVRSVVEASAADAAMSGIDLSMSGVDDPIVIWADAVRVEQMLWNLVRNALKFTPRGGQVTIALSRDDGHACIEVADTGRGIAPDFLPRIFDMFSQAEAAGNRERGGLGIGLSLVKQLSEMHGGRIEAHSAGAGKGARFRLWLPESPTARRLEPPSGSRDSSTLKELRVLLVDDSLEALDAFQMLLELEGAHVQAATSAEQALATAGNIDFDLILSDIGMPEMNGYEFIAALRKLPRMAKTPAIAVTGFGRKQDIAKALRVGFDAHLGKPVSLPLLLGAIERIRRAKSL